MGTPEQGGETGRLAAAAQQIMPAGIKLCPDPWHTRVYTQC